MQTKVSFLSLVASAHVVDVVARHAKNLVASWPSFYKRRTIVLFVLTKVPVYTPTLVRCTTDAYGNAA
jgi:hypothetical protein